MPDLLPPVRVLYIVLPNDPTEDELFGYAGVVDRLRPRQLLYSDDHPEALYLSYGTASAAEKAFKLSQQTWCPLFIPDTAVPPDLDTWDIEYDVENKEMRAGLRSEQGDSLDSISLGFHTLDHPSSAQTSPSPHCQSSCPLSTCRTRSSRGDEEGSLLEMNEDVAEASREVNPGSSDAESLEQGGEKSVEEDYSEGVCERSGTERAHQDGDDTEMANVMRAS